MAVLDDLKAFDVDAASVSLWVFRGPRGASNAAPLYTPRWVETTDDVDAVLKETVKAERNRVEEAIDYDLLAQNNEASALLIKKEETYAGLLVDAVASEVENRRAEDVKQLQNSTFYLVKLVHNDHILHAVRRTSSSWKTRRAFSTRTLILAENRLALDNSPRFDIETTIDFFILGDELLILNKARFESTLRYKEAHAADFNALQGEPEFSGLFTDVTPLIQHVGVNKIQLRRMCAVRQKGHYRDADFIQRVREHHAEYDLPLQFDPTGRIIVAPETCADVITVLLDHRLASGFSKRNYDVQNATPVSG